MNGGLQASESRRPLLRLVDDDVPANPHALAERGGWAGERVNRRR